MKNSIAIITARGGSKRIPRKNIKSFLGQPIISYSINAALESNCFDEVMVSTDDAEIADIALACGANVPFKRSLKNSDDFSSTADVLFEVLSEYRKGGKEFEYLCCIYPTAPFVTADKLNKGMDLLIKSEADCVLPIVEFSYPIERNLRINNGKVQMQFPENYSIRSQDFQTAYHDAGQFYCLQTQKFLQQKSLFPTFTLPLIISELEVQDIDNLSDWNLAEIKFKLLNNLL